MKNLVQEKEQAIRLRRQGLTYAAILNQVPVAKSTLSLWLKDLPLTDAERKTLKKIQNHSISTGRLRAVSANQARHQKNHAITLAAAKDIFATHQGDPLFHVGIALYWAEGAKRNEMFQFVNTDIAMIRVMLQWLERYTNYTKSDLGFRLYAHEPYRHEQWETWWQKQLGVAPTQFKKTVYKPTAVQYKKRPNYKGCLRVEVPKSAALLLQTKSWINFSVEYYRKR